MGKTNKSWVEVLHPYSILIILLCDYYNDGYDFGIQTVLFFIFLELICIKNILKGE